MSTNIDLFSVKLNTVGRLRVPFHKLSLHLVNTGGSSFMAIFVVQIIKQKERTRNICHIMARVFVVAVRTAV